MQAIQGIHHITAVASNPQANINFYHKVLGQRLVKRTVNFDDPSTYHFYFGDEIGTPGTILTFFPWPNMAPGQRGNGEVGATAYIIPTTSLTFWRERLENFGVQVGELQTRFDTAVLPLQDPDGMVIELVAVDNPRGTQVWQNGPIPQAHAIRGFYGATLLVNKTAPTAHMLTEVLGYQLIGQEGQRTRFKSAADQVGIYIDLLAQPGQPRGRFGAGSVHHIAFRTVDDIEQQEYLQRLRSVGQQVSPVMDRQYFHSIYFREPGGILFEIATDAPGFLYDEPVAELGAHLKLPPWLEIQRPQITHSLPIISVPNEA